MASGRKERWRLLFHPLHTEGGDVMTDFEMLSIVMMVISLIAALLKRDHKE